MPLISSVLILYKIPVNGTSIAFAYAKGTGGVSDYDKGLLNAMGGSSKPNTPNVASEDAGSRNEYYDEMINRAADDYLNEWGGKDTAETKEAWAAYGKQVDELVEQRDAYNRAAMGVDTSAVQGGGGGRSVSLSADGMQPMYTGLDDETQSVFGVPNPQSEEDRLKKEIEDTYASIMTMTNDEKIAFMQSDTGGAYQQSLEALKQELGPFMFADFSNELFEEGNEEEEGHIQVTDFEEDDTSGFANEPDGQVHGDEEPNEVVERFAYGKTYVIPATIEGIEQEVNRIIYDSGIINDKGDVDVLAMNSLDSETKIILGLLGAERQAIELEQEIKAVPYIDKKSFDTEEEYFMSVIKTSVGYNVSGESVLIDTFMSRNGLTEEDVKEMIGELSDNPDYDDFFTNLNPDDDLAFESAEGLDLYDLGDEPQPQLNVNVGDINIDGENISLLCNMEGIEDDQIIFTFISKEVDFDVGNMMLNSGLDSNPVMALFGVTLEALKNTSVSGMKLEIVDVGGEKRSVMSVYYSDNDLSNLYDEGNMSNREQGTKVYEDSSSDGSGYHFEIDEGHSKSNDVGYIYFADGKLMFEPGILPNDKFLYWDEDGNVEDRTDEYSKAYELDPALVRYFVDFFEAADVSFTYSNE